MPTKGNNAVTQRGKSNSVIVSNEDFLNVVTESSYDGFEGVSQDLLKMPWLKIAQALTKEIDETGSSYIKGLKQGMYFNSVSKKNYGRNVKMIFFAFKREFIEWEKGNLGNMINKYTKEEFIQAQKSGEVSTEFPFQSSAGNDVKETHTYLVMLPEHLEDGPMLFSLNSHGIRHSKSFLTMSKMSKWNNGGKLQSAPMYGVIWELGTMKNENKLGSWFDIGSGSNVAIKQVGTALDKEFDYLKPAIIEGISFAKDFKEKDISYSEDPPEKEIIVNDDDVPFS